MTNKNEITYINPFIRGASGAVDIFIVGFLRIVFVQIIGTFWINGRLIKFHQDFQEKFGVIFSSTNQKHVQFLINHQIVKVLIIFLILTILIGALYHAYLNSSSWSSTIGKRVFGLVLVKNEGKNLTFGEALGHYFLSLLPWIFTIYILTYQVKNKVTLYGAMTGNTLNLILGIITVIWIQIHILTKKKNTVNDLIIGCSMVKGKVGKGWPRFRSKKETSKISLN